ncbi:MAG: hypothetical protein RBR15_02065 [Sphaerochaeta sp.]|nr:hypothetical protein [Sphaerochaeta sp.]
MIDDATRERISKTMPMLAENQRRKYLGIEALALGYGGVKALSELTAQPLPLA